MTRWTDEAGDAWPVTGHWCDECGLPLMRVAPGDTGPHPTCRPGGEDTGPARATVCRVEGCGTTWPSREAWASHYGSAHLTAWEAS